MVLVGHALLSYGVYAIRFRALARAAFVPAFGVEAQACRAADATANYFVTDLRELTSSTKIEDGYQRRDLKIPVVDSTTVVLVTDDRICQQALATLNTTIPAGWPQATRVYLV